MARWIEPAQALAVWTAAAARPLPPSGSVGLPEVRWEPLGADWFAINSETGGWVILSDDERRLLDGLPADADVHDLGAPAIRRLLVTLWGRGVATIRGETALGNVDWDAVIDGTRTHYGLVLVLNSGCNLACAYCYLGHNAPVPDNELPPGLAHAAIDAALGRPEEQIIIDFGEISVALDHFLQLADYASAQAAARGKRLRVAVQTNATTLTDAVVQRLVRLNVMLGVSIDGPADLHDPARPRRGGRPTHALVLQGLRRCRAAGLRYHLIVTVGGHNVHDPAAVLDQIESLDPDTFLCKPILAHGEARTAWAQQGASPADIAAFLNACIERAGSAGLGSLDQSAAKFLLRLVGDSRGWREGCTSRHCSAGRNLHVLSARGEVHSCPRYVEPGRGRSVTPQTVDIAISARPLLGHTLRAQPATCHGCPWLRSCGGGCTLSGHDDDAAATPLPDQHCASYDAQHRGLIHHVIPALLRGDIPFDKTLAGARWVSDGGS